VTLFHNEDAGDGTSTREICTLLERYGHVLVHVLAAEASAEQVLDGAPDVVVAAGGDGTVAAAARVLAGRRVPLAILPLGTANNIARSLESDGVLEDLIRGWRDARRRQVDVGVARGEWGERVFFESVGAGLIPSGIAAAHAAPPDGQGSSTHQPGDAVRFFCDALSRLEPHRWTLTLDGVSTTGEFLLVEALNMPAIGPNLMLADGADPSDGFLSVVVATEEHRAPITRYLEGLEAGAPGTPPLQSHRVRRLEIYGWSDVHVDDELLRGRPSSTVSLSLQAGVLEVLTPRSGS
jgi:diacylglycerol kinase family enzyme